MAIYLVAARLSSGGTRTEHIAEVIWVDQFNYSSGRTSVAAIVEFIDDGGTAKVSDGMTTATVEVVRPANRQPYLRSTMDSSEQDNLLARPRFQ